MNMKFLATFGIILGTYLVGLGLTALWKWIQNKRHFKKEKKEKESNPHGEE